MKNMMIFTPLCLTLCWMLSVDSMRQPFLKVHKVANDIAKKVLKFSITGFPLDMADQSVDDMYDGCNDKASMDKIKSQFSKELTSGVYAQAWKNAQTCAVQKFNIRSSQDMALTKDHMQAICVYTANDVYSKLNTAVREQRKNYLKSFPFHILHSLLTTAIRILNPNHHCHTTYRRTQVAFTGTLNQKIRLSSFASSSYRTDMTHFGRETCFKINTCYGGYLKSYSVFNDSEQEVLIPPYEMFAIKDIVRPPHVIKGLEDCKIVYVLASAGRQSNLNCKLSQQHPDKQLPLVCSGQKVKKLFKSCLNC
ncbi:NAD(P)(+)--arginine ADP-ribosyltransferase 2-like [Melanotaenia boesemani]|uniref:NAD(P)(+)--arginine ADP-ribosyltransferase 2-like n=1 Tax=Melanotaenia boesemani TaxID=1250792 RepID=UPI001C054A18|nr:NAD(P)(+)--arginine ADP-ribosyltransferase 2-like [Melanotaenia boesemani]